MNDLKAVIWLVDAPPSDGLVQRAGNKNVLKLWVETDAGRSVLDFEYLDWSILVNIPKNHFLV